MNPQASELPASQSGEPTEKSASAVSEVWETTREKAGEALQTGERYVRDNPGTSALTIFGLGCLVGLIIGWSLGREEENDYSARARKFGKRWSKKLHLD